MTKKEDVNRTLCTNELVIRAPTFWPPVSQHQSVCAEEFSLVQIAVCLPPPHPPHFNLHGAHKPTMPVGREQTASGTQNSLPAFFWRALSARCLPRGGL